MKTIPSILIFITIATYPSAAVSDGDSEAYVERLTRIILPHASITEASFGDILDLISLHVKQTRLTVAVNSQVNRDRPFTIDQKNISVTSFLNVFCEANEASWAISGRTLAIFPRQTQLTELASEVTSAHYSTYAYYVGTTPVGPEMSAKTPIYLPHKTLPKELTRSLLDLLEKEALNFRRATKEDGRFVGNVGFVLFDANQAIALIYWNAGTDLIFITPALEVTSSLFRTAYAVPFDSELVAESPAIRAIIEKGIDFTFEDTEAEQGAAANP